MEKQTVPSVRLSYFFLIIFTILLLNACVVGPNYVTPSAPIPSHYKEARKGWKIAAPQDEINRGEWWKILKDSELDVLESQLNYLNQNIIAAEANYRQAFWLVKQARAQYFPTITGIATLMEQTELPTRFPPKFNYSVTELISALLLNASWEPDIWGKIHRIVEGRQAGAQASYAQLGAIQLSSQASLAQYYYELRTVDRDQIILDWMVINYQKALQIAKNGYQSGHSAYTDVVQAQSQLETAKALADHNRIYRTQYEHAIAVLIGKPPAEFTIEPRPLRSTIPPVIPIELPSSLLERRPDIAQAERLMAQANAQIGIAVSAYFPGLSLSATGGLLTNGFAPLFSAKALSFAVGGELAEVIFEGGYRRATTQAAWANYESTVASYRQTILSAFQEVEDNLAAIRILQSEVKHRELADKEAHESLKLILNAYKSGMNSYTDVIVAQAIAYQAEKDYADINGLQMSAIVGLIKALGGSYKVYSIP